MPEEEIVQTWILTREQIVEIFNRWITAADYTRQPSDNAEENADYFIAIAKEL